MPSNTKENGFETLIVDTLVNSNGYEQGITTEYNKQYAIDEDRLFRFLMSTQKKAMDELHILDSDLEKDRFFKQLDKKLKSDGVIELLRKGLRYKHLRLDLFYVRPSVHNPEAAALYEKNMVNGKLSETRFQMLADDYEQEQADLRAKIEMLENEIQNQEDQAENVDRFIRQAKKYLYLEKLTPTILNDMVNAVYVHAPDKSSGHRVQDVTISYNYIGILPANLLYDVMNGKAA